MESFIITFSKTGLRGGWVHVTAKNEEIARAWANYEYGRVWSGIYPPAQFFTPDVTELFPNGELARTTLAYEDADHVPPNPRRSTPGPATPKEN